MWKKQITGAVTAGLLAAFCLGTLQQPATAAPVITNMPHKADGTRITGNQAVPRGMPADVAVKTKVVKPPAPAPQPVIPKAEPVKPTAPAPQPVVPKAEPVKPTVPVPQPVVPKTEPVRPPAPAPQPVVPKTEPVKPPSPAPQPVVPKTEPVRPPAPAPQPVVPKTEPVRPPSPAPQPVAKTAPAKPTAARLPVRPPGWQNRRPMQERGAAERKRAARPGKNKDNVKSVYKVGDKGWKVKQSQQYLAKLGFNPGQTDGHFTKLTRKAVRQFQKKYKLKETGNLDNATYQELKRQVEAREYGGSAASIRILKTAAQYRGVPYVFGGTTPRGFDCSGYVQFVFARHGIRLTRTADTQALEGRYISRKALRPGDLVFFTTYEPGASHVGIYAGNNKFWNATSSRGIMLSDLTDSYWGPRYYTARRILAEK